MTQKTRRGETTPPEYPIPEDLKKVLDVKKKSAFSVNSQMYLKVLKSLKAMKYMDLLENHYVEMVKLALYLEEYQCREEMEKRKLFKQVIYRQPINSKCKLLFKIHAPHLDNEDPWVRENNIVDVTDTKTYRSYTLKVTYLKKNYIFASTDSRSFYQEFEPRRLYNISFRFQNYTFRCAHYALRLMYSHKTITYLFPSTSKPFVTVKNKTYDPLKMFNPNIEANPQQKQAVLHIVNKSSFPAPYILYGPPGTGKTATLVEAIVQIHKAFPLNCILVCTPSNTAADEIARRLLKFIETSEVCRIYSPSKDPSTIDEELKSCSYGGGTANKQTDEFINKKAILVSTLCYAMRFVLMGLRASYFSHIFIDETGQGIEPDVLIPISIASKNRKLYSQIVVAGDPQQLGPTVTSKLAEVILGRSILERLISYNIYQKNYHGNYNPKYITKLLRNYRSHPKILHISNELFYDNQLLPQLSIDNNQKVQFPVIFHAVDGLEEKSSYSPSTFNVKEINVVLKYVYDLINNKTEFGQVTAEDIGIVTPFKEQSMRIKKILQQEDAKEKKKIKDNVDTENTVHVFEKYKKGEKNELKSDEVIQNKNTKETNIKIKDDKEKLINEVGKDGKTKVKVQKIKNAKCQAANDVNEIKCRNLKNINVGTVELFQGQERKIIIMTTVRSKLLLHDGKQHLGFLSNPKRFNVAMTRAQAALIVIGNPRILQEDEMWRYFLKYCIDNGSYRGYKFALSESHSNNPKPVLSGSQRITTSAKLFKGKPFKFFPLDAIESKKMTADVLAKSRRCKYKEPAQSKLCESFRKLSLT